jgi:hypothetical protein
MDKQIKTLFVNPIASPEPNPIIIALSNPILLVSFNVKYNVKYYWVVVKLSMKTNE